jgi:phage shock protein E
VVAKSPYKNLFVTFVTNRERAFKEIGRLNSNNMIHIDENATVVDVRTPVEFAKEHFPGAVNIPLDKVPLRIDEFKQMSKPIIAYCRSGNRSRMAVSLLNQFGIKEAINGGGLMDMIVASKYLQEQAK